MPVITIEGPFIKDMEKRRTFVEQLTVAATKVYDMPKETIIVLIRENNPEQVAVAGELISDR